MKYGEQLQPQEIEAAFRRMLQACPGAGVAAVRDNGLFRPLPDGVRLTSHHQLDGHAGIELVSAESRALILEQFRQLDEHGASEVEVRLASGNPGRYALFDTRATYGVIMLVIVEGEPDEDDRPLSLPDLAPVRPRYGRAKRNETGKLLEVDDQVLDLLGYSREEFFTLGAEAVHPDDYRILVSQWFDLLTAPLGSSRRVRMRHRRGDGTWLWVEVTNTRLLDEAGDVYVAMEMVDISEEMAAMDEVWRSRELLRRLTQALPVGVLQIDTGRNVIYANDRLHQIVGVGRADTLTDQLASIVDDDAPALEEAVSDVLSTGAGADRELRFRLGKHGPLRYAQLAFRGLQDRDSTVTGAIICVTDVTASTRMRQELEVRASSDVLTGCFNRAAVMAEIERALISRTHGTAVVFVDLDGFKPINDELGHAAGDELLKSVAERLQRVVRAGDVVGRLGGDEFVVLCPDVASRNLAGEIADRVAGAVCFDASLAGSTIQVKASVGVAWTAEEGGCAERLVAAADAAMYQAKRAGDNRAVVTG